MTEHDERGPVITEDGSGLSKRTRVLLWVAGVLLALGAITFFVMFGPPNVAARFATPGFCGGTCHEMQPWLEGFEEADHSELDSCQECHMPHGNVVEYYFWEAVVGVRDVAEHAVGYQPETFEATERSSRWILENCHRCHDDDIEEDHGEERDVCWDCHDDEHHDVDQEGAGTDERWLASH